MTKTSLISVIVPIYNVEQYLKQCVDSILNQTYANLEIILVNDGSPDNSPSICDKYALKDSRVKVIHKKNGGLSDARNAGLDVAKGEYIVFIDSDDFIHKQYVECLYSNIGVADMAFCDLLYYYDDEIKIDELEIKECKIQVFEDDFLIRNIPKFRSPLLIVAWNKLYKREIWQDLRYPIGKIHEDEFLAHYILDKCESVVFCDTKLYNYRQRHDSIMGRFSESRFLNILEFHDDRERFYLERNMNNEALYTYNSKFSSYLRPQVDKNNILFRTLSLKQVLLDKRIRVKTKVSIFLKKIHPSLYDVTLKLYLSVKRQSNN